VNACVIAIDAFDKLKMKKALGMTDHGVNLKSLIDRFLPDMSTNPASTKMRMSIINNHLKPYFGGRDLYNIDDGDIKAYIQWRNDTFKPSKWAKEGLAVTSIMNELRILRFFLSRAFSKRLILTMPSFPLERHINRGNLQNLIYEDSPDRRGHWDDEQDAAISIWLSNFRKRWKNSIDLDRGLPVDHKQLLPTHRRDRYTKIVFYMLVTLIRQSGIRSVELRKMRIECVNLYKDPIDKDLHTLITITAQMSKVGKKRECVSSNMGTMMEIWEDYKYEWERYFKRPPVDTDYAFPKPSMPDKTREISQVFRHQMLNVDKECGITMSTVTNTEGTVKPINMYSLRKSYITKMLQNPNMNVYVLSRQCGTSLEMFERYYNVNLGRVHRKVFTQTVRHLRDLDKARQDNVGDETE